MISTTATTMKGILLTGHGGPEMLHYRDDIPIPTPSADEVLIRVAAAGVNNTDINTRIAWYSKKDGDSADSGWSGNALTFPRIQGADVCGTIVAVGDNVSGERIGERVLIEPCLTKAKGQQLNPPWYFGSECDGGFAQYTVVAAQHAFAVDSPLSDVQLASFPCSYSTAENMLTRANVTAQDTVLISGASGGVGSAAIQLAKARGADLVKGLGKNSVDVVIDLVAGKQWPEFLQVLRPHGRYAVSGAIAGPLVELDVIPIILNK